jgi:tRNA 2-selenouridine synthase
MIDVSRDARLDFLVRDYAYLGDDIATLQANLHRLREHQSRETLERWQALAAGHALPELFGELIDQHYDPLYRRSQNGNYAEFGTAPHVATDDLSEAGIRRLAADVLALERSAAGATNAA